MSELAVLGAGVTGLGAGLIAGCPVYEAAPLPGGICTSYYMTEHGAKSALRTNDREDYRFEIGGGHWIFGGDSEVRKVFERYATFREYERRSSVYLPKYGTFVPYPLQDHIDALPQEVQLAIEAEHQIISNHQPATMQEWLRQSFGDTLCGEFFEPFHDLYTAGFYTQIAPQDAYKTPNPAKTNTSTSERGYNARFIYPTKGLSDLFTRIASDCDVRYKMKAISIDIEQRSVLFENGESASYETLLSTLPLHTMMQLTGLDTGVQPGPYTSVLVLNIAATRGTACPDAHWVYLPESRAGFHRIGFYDNVDKDFLPKSKHSDAITSMYIEKAYPGGTIPSEEDIRQIIDDTVAQLREWGFIDTLILADPTFVEVAYTWSYPGSAWKERSIALLKERGIHQIGRYGRWHFQGIAASFKEGMHAAKSLAHPQGTGQ